MGDITGLLKLEDVFVVQGSVSAKDSIGMDVWFESIVST